MKWLIITVFLLILIAILIVKMWILGKNYIGLLCFRFKGIVKLTKEYTEIMRNLVRIAPGKIRSKCKSRF